MRNSPATLTNTTPATVLQRCHSSDDNAHTPSPHVPTPANQTHKHNQKIMYNSNKLYYKGVKQYRDIRYNVVYYKGVKPISWLGNGLNIRTIIYY